MAFRNILFNGSVDATSGEFNRIVISTYACNNRNSRIYVTFLFCVSLVKKIDVICL